jgi:dGTPase
LASIIKYGRIIPCYRGSGGVEEGIYKSEKAVFDKVIDSVCRDIPNNREFKSIECSIMDVADDIAYSTYDLEDTFKAEFLDPLKILGSSTETKKSVANKVGKNLKCQFDEHAVDRIFLEIFSGLGDNVILPQGSTILLAHATDVASASRQLTSNGYLRTQFTADLVSEFISGVELQFDDRYPVLSYVRLRDAVAQKVETLKHYTYEATIMASRLRVPEQRGYDIVDKLFEKLESPKGYLLLPEDYRNIYESLSSNDAAKKRVLCDFIAGMTDRYAVEFYCRIFSDSPQSIFKPL